MNRLDHSICDIINEQPIVGEFLLYNDIDCAGCTLGTCKLKDILSIHNYDQDTQEVMMAYLDKIINGETTKLEKFIPVVIEKINYPIIERLMIEHQSILQLIYIVEYIIKKDNFMSVYQNELSTIVNYFKLYADDFHHGKEEDILFVEFGYQDIIGVMNEEHTQGRALVKIINSTKDENILKNALIEYTTLLKEHINKEDNILFPYLNNQMTPELDKKINNLMMNYDLIIENELNLFIDNFNNNIF